MSIESLGLWGCARSGALDIWNNDRTYAYMRNCNRVVAACTTRDAVDYLPIEDDPESHVKQVYTSPAANNAWWYDAARPESSGFFGLEVIRVSGLYENTLDYTVTPMPQTGCGNSLLYSDPVDNGYEIVVEGILHGASCCAVRYGFLALKKALRGCCGTNRCSGTALRYMPCVPTTALTALGCQTSDCDLPAEDTSSLNPWRFVKNARCIEEPHITSGAPDGSACSNNCGCTPDTWVSFTIRAESGQYTYPTTVIDTTIAGDEHCITDISLCDCDRVDPLSDPDCIIPTIPAPPNAASSCFCPIFSTDRKCVEFTLPQSLFDYQLEFEMNTGLGIVKNFRVLLWKKIGDYTMASGLYDKCNACAGFGLTPLPAGTVWGTSCGGITVAVPGYDPVNASRTLLSAAGQPSNACMRVSCGTYIMCIYSDPNFSPVNATIKVSYRGVEP